MESDFERQKCNMTNAEMQKHNESLRSVGADGALAIARRYTFIYSTPFRESRHRHLVCPELLQLICPAAHSNFNRSYCFLLDSGAAGHCCHQKHRFRNMTYGSFGYIVVADGNKIPVTAKGDVDVEVGGVLITLYS